MKMKDLRELTGDELVLKHDQLLRDLFGMRIKHALGQLENPLQLRATKREVARVRTLLALQGVKEVRRPRRLAAPGARPAARTPKSSRGSKADAAAATRSGAAQSE
jgi:large subunit ribosomal protein L29